VRMESFREIKSPVALATFGAFFVPEPFGVCLVLFAAIWWLRRKVYHSDDVDLLLEVSGSSLDFYIFRAERSVARTVVLPIDRAVYTAPLLPNMLR